MTLLNILLQAQPAGGGMGSIIMIVALIAIFYFFMIRPQSKKQKEIRKFRESLKNGDKVITAGGIYGKIKEGNRERIQVFEGVVLKRQGGSTRETFTVRKFSNGVGVEKTWPLHSPIVEKIEVVRLGKVRRAKLNYLRGRVGKAAKVKELVK